MNKEILLSYTEFSKDDIENVLDINPAQQPPQRNRRPSQFFRSEFLTASNHRNAAMQHIRRLPQQFPLPLAPDQTVLARPEKIPRKDHDSRDQLLDAISPGRRNSELRPPH